MHKQTDIKLSPKNFRMKLDASLNDVTLPMINLLIPPPEEPEKPQIKVLTTKQKPTSNSNELF